MADLVGGDETGESDELWERPEPKTDLAQRLRRYREGLHLTQAELAERAGLRQGLITSIEQGQYRPSRRVALALASALDVPVQELLGEVKVEYLHQPAPVPAGFARRLRERREALHLTCRELAGRAGLHHSYISHLEHGVSHPSAAVAAALAGALDLPVYALVAEEPQERPRPETGLPANLRAQRETLGLSQAALARRAGISTSHVKAIESGRSRPTLEVIACLAAALEMSEEDLLGEQDRAEFRARSQPASELGERLRRRRQALHRTIEDVAAPAGLTATSLGQIELGAWQPSRALAQALATALDMSLEDLADAPTLALLHDERPERSGFAQRLYQRRTARHLTQAALASAAGVDAHYVSVLEHGLSRPSVEMASTLAAALAVSLEDLLGDEDPGDLHAWHRRHVGLGRRVRERRKAMGLTQEDLARHLGISRPALSRLEHDIVEPTTRMLNALAAALDTTPDALV